MKKFEKLSRAEMKNVKGGSTAPPACVVGSICLTHNELEGNCVAGPVDSPCRCEIYGVWDKLSYCVPPGS